MTFKKISLIVMIATASLIAGFLYHQLSLSNNNSQTDLLYELNLTDSKEQKKDLAQYKNDWLMINFWATWCAPCREEIPELNDFFKTKKIKLIGIALDDVDSVNKFTKKIPIKYPSYIIDDINGVKLSRSLGNERGVLPFTVIINPKNEVSQVFYGKVKIGELNQYLKEVLSQ